MKAASRQRGHGTGPTLVAHADWAHAPAGRAMVVARRGTPGWNLAQLKVGDPSTFARRLVEAGGGPVVLGVDVPLGLPRRYASARGIASFDAFVRGLDPIDPIFMPADADTLSLGRPFYPARPGGASHAFQAERLGVVGHRDLWRLCDHPTTLRSGASCLFWTLGAKQCGKAALAFWRHGLLPAFALGLDVALWPFAGSLADLTARHALTIVETYPGECYGQIGLPRFAKTREADRKLQAERLAAMAASLRARLDPALATAVVEGFPPAAGADHALDALVGCLALLNVLGGRRPEGVPDDPVVRGIEGWMLGLDGASLRLH